MHPRYVIVSGSSIDDLMRYCTEFMELGYRTTGGPFTTLEMREQDATDNPLYAQVTIWNQAMWIADDPFWEDREQG